VAAKDALCSELSGRLVGREVPRVFGSPAGEIIRVCPPRELDKECVFFWEVEVYPKPDDGQGTWSLNFDTLDQLGIIARETTLTIFRRHLGDSVRWV
jgi:hypothetical protein